MLVEILKDVRFAKEKALVSCNPLSLICVIFVNCIYIVSNVAKSIILENCYAAGMFIIVGGCNMLPLF